MLTNIQIQDITNQKILISDLTDADLLDFCKILNQSYRDGNPIVSDEDYDFIFIPELSKRVPNHPFLQKVESEDEGFSEDKIKLPKKCYQQIRLIAGMK